jgi:hypothetical protein
MAAVVSLSPPQQTIAVIAAAKSRGCASQACRTTARVA